MIAWKEKGLAGEDMIHFTRAGAKKVGEMLATKLIEDYDLFVESQKPKVDSVKVDTTQATATTITEESQDSIANRED